MRRPTSALVLPSSSGRNCCRDPDGDPIDKPSSPVEQPAWLAEAGFVGVDAHRRLAGHAIFSGRKPRTRVR